MKTPLYVSDLDGTLLDSEAQLSPFTRNTLQQLLAEGLLLTIATSRSLSSVRHIFRDLEINLPVIEVNGAYISNLETGQHDAVSEIHSHFLPELLEISRSHCCNPLVSSTDGLADHLYCTAISNDGMAWYAKLCEAEQDPRWQRVSDLQLAFEEQVVRFTLIQAEAPVKAAACEIQQKLGLNTHLFENPYHRGWFWLTVQSPQSTKAHAIEKLRSLPHLASLDLHHRELVVFGDEQNDLEMFQLADRAIAPANAVPPIRALAHTIIGPHDEDSVAHYLREDWAALNDPSL